MHAFAIAALLLAPVPADPFCDALKQIVADEPGNFSTLAGAPQGTAGDSWHASVVPALDPRQDASCFIGPDDYTGGKPSRWHYVCYAAYPIDNAPTDADVGALADRAARCFDVAPRVIQDPERGPLGYPSERRIVLAPLEIVINSYRMEFVTINDGPWRAPAPYVGGSSDHDYWMVMDVRRISRDAHGA